jgi:hypothetical protein
MTYADPPLSEPVAECGRGATPETLSNTMTLETSLPHQTARFSGVDGGNQPVVVNAMNCKDALE